MRFDSVVYYCIMHLHMFLLSMHLIVFMGINSIHIAMRHVLSIDERGGEVTTSLILGDYLMKEIF